MMFLAGLLVGVTIGILAAALCNACRCGDEIIEQLHEARQKEYK
jgi:hypothetical protein